jgi:thiosulfate reductase cytochrome b subunit
MEPYLRTAQSTSPPPSERLYAKHPLAVRILHWANFVVIAILVWTAFLLLSGTPELSWSHWLPQAFYSTLHLDNRNDEGRVWHVLFSFIMIAVGILYAVYLSVSRRWKTLVPTVESWRDAYLVILHDVGLKPHRATQIKYNGAQRIAYTVVVFMCLGEVITGLLIYFKSWTALADLLGGEIAVRFEHFILMLGILAFVIVHLIQVARAGWNNFRAMVIGLEIVHEDVGHRLSAGHALAEPALTTIPASKFEFEQHIRRRSRRGFVSAAFLGAMLLLFGLFVHTQSNTPDRVPSWLNWARDVDAAPMPKNASRKADSGRTTSTAVHT